MKQKLHLGARLIFGLAFFIFGINGFLNFMPTPPMTTEAGTLLEALGATGYFFPMIKIIEMVAGILLIANYLAPFAVVLITPILIGITTIHLFLNPAGIPMMIVLHLLHGYLVVGYKSYYKSLFARKSEAFLSS